MKSRRVIALLAAGILLMSVASCGGSPASSASNAPAEQPVEQTTESTPAEQADEQTAESAPVEQAVEQTTSNAPAEEAVEQTAESVEDTAEQIPEEEAIPEGSEVTESESEDGTKSTEIIKPDGSIRLVLEAPDGSRTETDYDSQLYPQSRVVYDEDGKKTSESTYKYDEDQLDTLWESVTSYDENGNVEYISETESIYPEEEAFKYGTEFTPEPDKLYYTKEGVKFGKDLLPEPLPISSETVVKGAQGEFVKTISMDIEGDENGFEIVIKYANGSSEKQGIVPTIGKNGKSESIYTAYWDPYDDEPYKMVSLFKDGRTRVTEYENGSRVSRDYDKDGNVISERRAKQPRCIGLTIPVRGYVPPYEQNGGYVPRVQLNRGYVPGAENVNRQNRGYVPSHYFANRRGE